MKIIKRPGKKLGAATDPKTFEACQHCHRLLDDGIVWRSLKSEVAETILKIADDFLIDDWNKQNPKKALGDCARQPHVCKKPDACRRESALETRWSLSTVLLTKTKCLAWSAFWQIRPRTLTFRHIDFWPGSARNRLQRGALAANGSSPCRGCQGIVTKLQPRRVLRGPRREGQAAICRRRTFAASLRPARTRSARQAFHEAS